MFASSRQIPHEIHMNVQKCETVLNYALIIDHIWLIIKQGEADIAFIPKLLRD